MVCQQDCYWHDLDIPDGGRNSDNINWSLRSQDKETYLKIPLLKNRWRQNLFVACLDSGGHEYHYLLLLRSTRDVPGV